MSNKILKQRLTRKAKFNSQKLKPKFDMELFFKNATSKEIQEYSTTFSEELIESVLKKAGLC